MVTVTAGPTAQDDRPTPKRVEYRMVGPSLIQCECNGLVPTTNANLHVKSKRQHEAGLWLEYGWKCPKCGTVIN